MQDSWLSKVSTLLTFHAYRHPGAPSRQGKLLWVGASLESRGLFHHLPIGSTFTALPISPCLKSQDCADISFPPLSSPDPHDSNHSNLEHPTPVSMGVYSVAITGIRYADLLTWSLDLVQKKMSSAHLAIMRSDEV
jgi:hypothetical protein